MGSSYSSPNEVPGPAPVCRFRKAVVLGQRQQQEKETPWPGRVGGEAQPWWGIKNATWEECVDRESGEEEGRMPWQQSHGLHALGAPNTKDGSGTRFW